MTRYRIRALDPHAHLFEVRCTVDDPNPRGQTFRLPVWIPGSYLVREFARHFVAVGAECGHASVAIIKTAKDAWRAEPCDGPLTVVATVYAFELSVRTAYLDATRGYFNGSAVFLCPDDREHAPCLVDIQGPEGEQYANWRVATTLPSAGAGAYEFGAYRADDYDALIDHPVEMSVFALATFHAGDAVHDIAVSGRQSGDLTRMATDLARVCQWQIDLFNGGPGGRAPFARYLFQITAAGEGYGGLEHRSSTSLLCKRDELPHPGMTDPSAEYITLLGLASHEYFHAYNVKRIKPAAFTPYDLGRENYTRLLWAFEGFTSYYDDLALARSGVITQERYLELIGRTITSMLRNPGRHWQSIADSSFDAWIKFYRQDENTPNAVVSYYAKGAVIGLALDLLLRMHSASLDDLMRRLWQRFGQTGQGVPEDGVRAIAVELAGTEVEDFFARYIDGVDDPPLAEALEQFGVTMRLRPSLSPKDRGGTAGDTTSIRSSMGVKVSPDCMLAHVYTGGAAERAGLAPGDALIALDGLKADADTLAKLFERRAPGERVAVHAFRRDELLVTEVVLDPVARDTCYLLLDAQACADALARRRGWLGI